MSSEQMPKTGKCHCGNVTYSIIGEPVRMAQCHCNACRRITGTGHNVQAFFRAADVTISGETQAHESVADSGSARTRHFCANCGSRLFSYNGANPAIIGIAAGSLDNSDWFDPQVILYGAERKEWDPVDPAKEIHDFM